MRFAIGFFLALTLTSPPVWAQATPPGTHIGGIYCAQPVSCPSGIPALSTPALLDIANACVTQYFGHSSPAGFFDAAAGLDTNNCLSTIPGVWPKGMGSQMAPSCCVVPRPNSPDGTCAVRCGLDIAP